MDKVKPRIQSLETDEGGRRMASAWNTKKKSNSTMKEKELGAVTPSRRRRKRRNTGMPFRKINDEAVMTI